MSDTPGPANDEISSATIHAAIERGITLRQQQVEHALQDAQRTGGQIHGVGQNQTACNQAGGGKTCGGEQAARRE